MNFNKTLLLLATWFCAGAAVAAELPPPSIGVSPTRIEIQVDHDPATGAATVLNLSSEPVRIATSVVNFDLDEASNFRELPPTDGSLPTAMMVNPVDFTIPPKSSQTVRFAIKPERLAGAGEHRAMLFFSELTDTSEPTVKINFRLGVPIYAQRGPAVASAELHGLALNETGDALRLDVSAAGTTQIRPQGHYVWWRADKFPGEQQAFRQIATLARNPERTPPGSIASGKLTAKPVFPGTRRALTARISPPADAGSHVLAVRFNIADETFERSFRFSHKADG